MLESILITTGPIAVALVVFAVLRLRGAKSSKSKLVAEYKVSGEEDETDALGDEVEQAQRLWRRSHSK